MKQNTEEWKELRKKMIGASDAPIILGVSPYKTPYQLWEEKLGIRESPTLPHMQRGHDLEPVARDAYTKHTGTPISPQVVFHPEIDYMMASLDGIDPMQSVIVEIKTANPADHELAHKGLVPEKYIPQLQHQLAVGLALYNIEMLHYFSYRNGDFKLVEVSPDKEMIERIIEEEGNFINYVRNFTAPPLGSKDVTTQEGAEWNELAKQFISVNERVKEKKQELKTLQEEESKVKEALIECSGGVSAIGGGVKLLKSVCKGTIDYKSIPELKVMDLEPYRKEPIVKWLTSVVKC